MDELQELSRRAVASLPAELREKWGCYRHCIPILGADNIIRPMALHESTEACTEIMVRVLAKVDGVHMLLGAECFFLDSANKNSQAEEHHGDPMLAFRVAVLKALIALPTEM